MGHIILQWIHHLGSLPTRDTLWKGVETFHRKIQFSSVLEIIIIPKVFFSNRQLKCLVSGELSGVRAVTCGVLQESHIGPLLFLK